MTTPGLAELAEVVKAFRNDTRSTGRLVLECCPSVVAALRAYGGYPEYVPPPPIAMGTGAAWRSVEVHSPEGMELGFWRLLEDGEIITSGTIGPVAAGSPPEEPA